MKLPDLISGPTFSKGDLVSFEVEGSSISMKILDLPRDMAEINKACSSQDIEDWFKASSSDEFDSIDIVTQAWTYFEDTQHMEVGEVFFKAGILKHANEYIEQNIGLNSDSFREHIMNLVHASDDYLTRTEPYCPTPKNNYFLKLIDRPLFDGFQYQYYLQPSDYPSCVAFFNLDERLSLRLSISFTSIHYEDIKNPYSEETLHKMKMDLFDDLLSTVQIEYSPEFIEKVNKFNS